MRFIEDYKIDGVPLLAMDQDAEITRTDLDSSDSGRDESGCMHRIIVRSRVKTWAFSYSSLSAREYAYLKSLFADKEIFAFTYVEDGVTKVTDAYCSNDSITYRNAQTGRYMNFKFKIIEC